MPWFTPQTQCSCVCPKCPAIRCFSDYGILTTRRRNQITYTVNPPPGESYGGYMFRAGIFDPPPGRFFFKMDSLADFAGDYVVNLLQSPSVSNQCYWDYVTGSIESPTMRLAVYREFNCNAGTASILSGYESVVPTLLYVATGDGGIDGGAELRLSVSVEVTVGVWPPFQLVHNLTLTPTDVDVFYGPTIRCETGSLNLVSGPQVPNDSNTSYCAAFPPPLDLGASYVVS